MTASSLSDQSHWLTLAPWLSVEGAAAAEPVAFAADQLAAIGDHLRGAGYLPPLAVFTAAEIEPVRCGIEALKAAGLPPVFIYLYDEPWRLFARLSELLGHFLGDDFALLPHFWAWHVPAEAGAAGWPPHTDCQAETRFDDGLGGEYLLSLSLWVPLVDVGTENACMVVLPRAAHVADQDPALHKGVALPAPAGSVLGWPQDLYHWSTAMPDRPAGPRLSLSLEFQNRAFAPLATPLLDPSSPTPFTERLLLMARQIPKYQHMEAVAFDPAVVLE